MKQFHAMKEIFALASPRIGRANLPGVAGGFAVGDMRYAEMGQYVANYFDVLKGSGVNDYSPYVQVVSDELLSKYGVEHD